MSDSISDIWAQLPADGSAAQVRYNQDLTAVAGVWRGPNAKAIGRIVEHLAHLSPESLAAIRAVVGEHIDDGAREPDEG